ncbi:MAG: large conductance mechanosensitive channel protein MscL [Clostridia bacterium]|nr:large conductance mechanosensitive channel protein MscL [Clostridia bacterium]
MKLVKEFKKFISKGNVIDMAVGVVIGGSFGKIVTGLVNYIINPFIGIFVKEGSLDTLKTVIHDYVPAELDASGAVVTPEQAEVAILWGTWLQTIIDFLITAICIFVVITIISRGRRRLEAKKLAEEAAKKAEEDAKAKAAADALAAKQAQLDASVLQQAELLAEIRDLLKNK